MLATVLDYIARTNLFNFTIFAIVIALIFRHLNVIGKIDKGAEIVSENIEDSKAAKVESETNLSEIKEKVANLENEIDEIIEKAKSNAHLVGEQILSDADKTAQNIQTNFEKTVENKTALLKNDIMKRASLASVEVAKNQIIAELNNNKELHNKLINESIEAINEVEYNG